MELMTLWVLFNKMDIVSQFIVALLLFGMLPVCIVIAYIRRRTLNLKIKQLQSGISMLDQVDSLDDMLDKSKLFNSNMVGNLLSYYLTEFKIFLRGYDVSKLKITDQDWGLFQSRLMGIVDQEIEKEESGIEVLSTSAAIGPLLGLFGTVWGLVDSFLSLSDQSSNGIAQVSIGMAEALLTTVAGLVVAIPALIFYNYITAKLKTFESLLIKATEKCSIVMKLALEKRQQNESMNVYASVASTDNKQKEL